MDHFEEPRFNFDYYRQMITLNEMAKNEGLRGMSVVSESSSSSSEENESDSSSDYSSIEEWTL